VTGEAFGANLRRFAELARSEDFELVFIDYPMSSTSHVTPSTVERMTQMLGRPRPMFAKHAAYQQVMRKVAREADVPVLDTIERVASDEAAFFSRLDMVHANGDGARLLAELLLARLDELGWLDAP
jgi:lysophospholipase L1-like esterase